MSEFFVIQGSKFGARLELSSPRWDQKTSDIISFSARYVAENIEVSNHVDAYMNGPHLFKFFQDLAESWKGWKGQKIWESLEGELKLSCSMDSTGNVDIQIHLRHNVYPGPWSVEGIVEIEAGRLDELAKSATKFFQKR